jgi:hypothetical protein
LLLTAAAPANSQRAAGPVRALGASQAADVGADFNADGFDDLAVGVPGESVSVGDRDIKDAGAVHVIYGSRTGLNGKRPLDDEVWNQNRLIANPSGSEQGDSFGYALAAGDFTGDGFDDLAVGVPGEAVTGPGPRPRQVEDAGEVDLLRGSRIGLLATNVVLRETYPVGSVPQTGDYFGFSLAAGDVGSGEEDDLIVGVPYEDWPRAQDSPTVKDAGAVVILYSTGIQPEGWFYPATYITQDSRQDIPDAGVADQSEPGDRFGFSVLAAELGKPPPVGDHSSSDRSSRLPSVDLVIGVPYEDVGAIKDAGAVHVLFGSEPTAGAVSFWGNQFWHQNAPGVPDRAEAGDHFGWALAAANFDGFGRTGDLAIGVPEEGIGNHPRAGAVNVLYRSTRTNRLEGKRAQVWHQGRPGIRGRPEIFDRFGYALTVGEFGYLGPADLAVGVPYEGIERRGRGDAKFAGGVNILMGTRGGGLSARNNLFESQDTSGFDGAVEGDSETVDLFGRSLSSGNFGRGPGTDLAIGVPYEAREHLLSVDDKVGAVNVLYSDHVYGTRASDDQFWWQASDALHDKAEDADLFGSALAN